MSRVVGKAYYLEGDRDWDSMQVNVFVEPDEMGRIEFVRVSNRTEGCERDIVFRLAPRIAKRIVVSNGATGHSECGACGCVVDMRDGWCRACGARLSPAPQEATA